MEDTDVDKIVRENFPDLTEHSRWLEGLREIAKNIKSEQAIYRNKLKPHLDERRDLLKDARLAGVDTKALKQMALVVDFLDKNVINVHDKIGEDAGDTAQAMFDQFSLPFADFRPGKDLIAEAKRKHAEAKAKKAEEIKAAKAKAKADGDKPKGGLKAAAARTPTGQKKAKAK